MSWKEMKDKILEAVEKVEVNTPEDLLVKTSILFYIYKSIESEEVFNKNCNILNEALLEEKIGVKKK